MNQSPSLKHKKSRAQAMMEFALALPILLTLLYGVLETGRLLFIYASTITAARQAVRYGSATGEVGQVPGGYEGVPFYQYCKGIRAAANKVGFINTFESINIFYGDSAYEAAGVTTVNGIEYKYKAGDPKPLNPTQACGKDNDENISYIPKNGDRIVVIVTTQWQPIVNFLPLKPLTITSSSKRTIIAAISIVVTPMPQNSGLLVLSVEPSKTTYSAKDEPIEFVYTLTNSSGATAALTGAYKVVTTINGSAATTNCTIEAPASIEPGVPYLCKEKYTYAVTQPNLDAGSFTSSSVGTAGSATSAAVTKSFTAIPLPKLTLSITPSSTVGSKGTVITYTYKLSNTGNVSLTSPYTIIGSNKFPSVDCSGVVSPLAPGVEKPCTTTTYTIKDEDINAGSVVNTATATAKLGSAIITSEPASATVLTPPLILRVSATSNSELFQKITYDYKITNNSGGNLSLQGVTGTANGSCLNVTISNGNDCLFTEIYTATLPDYDNVNLTEIVRQNTASATMIGTSQTLNSTTITTRVALKRQEALSISQPEVTFTPPTMPMSAGTTVTFKYSLKNTGNVTLSAPFTVDNGVITACGDIASLAPDASGYCSVTYPVSELDRAAGSFTKTAAASGYFSGRMITITSPSVATPVPTFIGARFSITASGLQSGSKIDYTYKITNTGSEAIKSPIVTLSHADNGSNDSASWTVTCPNTTITPGGSITCTSTKTFTTSGNYKVTVTGATATIVTGGGTIPATTPLPSVTVSTYICTTSNLTLNVSAADLKGSKLIQQFTLTNNVGAPLHLKSLEFNWQTTNGGLPVKLSSVSLFPGQGATKIWFWTGTDSDGYFNSTPYLTSPVTIGAGTTELKMTFTNASLTVTGLKLYFVESELGCGSRVYN